MSTEPTLTLEAELPAPMPAAALYAFLYAADKAMNDVTIQVRLSAGQPDKPTVILTATGTAKTRPHTAYRNRGEA